jgi:hypothetical protein
VLLTGYNTSNFSRTTTLWENLLYSAQPRGSENYNGFSIDMTDEEYVANFGEGYKVFPNPTDLGYFTIFTPDLDGKVSLSTTDLNGRTILSQNMDVKDESVRVKSEDLSAGIYIVRLSKGQNTFSSKLIVK